MRSRFQLRTAIAIGLLCAACSPAADPPDVLLITIDTTRADALGAYGGRLAKTPHLDALAGESVVFRNAITTTPYTGAAHASMLTGLYPPQHGLRDFLFQTLGESPATLAERFAAAGYESAAFVSTYVLDPIFGLARGFELYASDFVRADRSKALVFPPKGRLERPAAATVDEVEKWLESRDPSRPFFAWVHLYDPHGAYLAPPEFRAELSRQLGRDERLRRRYHEEVSYADDQVGRLLSTLARSGRGEALVVAVSSDHGEHLGGDGRKASTHSPSLADATLRVPLILRVPGVPAGRVDAQVRTLDLFATLLEAAGLAVPEGVEARSLLPLARGDESASRPAYSETFYEHYPQRAEAGEELASLRFEGWKLLVRPGRESLYDLQADPQELEDVAVQHPERVARLRAELERLRGRWPRESRGTALELNEDESREHLERLRALGYVE